MTEEDEDTDRDDIRLRDLLDTGVTYNFGEEGREIIVHNVLLRQRIKLAENINDSATDDEFIRNNFQDLVVFFALVSEKIDHLGKVLFVQEIMSDRIKEMDDVNDFLVVNEMSNESMFEILRHYRLIGKELFENIGDTKDFRNHLVHSTGVYRFEDLDSLSEKVAIAGKVENQLREKVDMFTDDF